MLREFALVLVIGSTTACNGGSSTNSSQGGDERVTPSVAETGASAASDAGTPEPSQWNRPSATGTGTAMPEASAPDGASSMPEVRADAPAQPAGGEQDAGPPSERPQAAGGSGGAPQSGDTGGAPSGGAGAVSTTDAGPQQTPMPEDGGAASSPPDSCEDFECPEFGNCGVQGTGDSCKRVCTLAPSDTVALATQEDVDRFAALRCERIAGSLVIGGSSLGVSDITSLQGLQTIRELTGYLNISLANITTIDLPNLRVVSDYGAQYSGEIGLEVYSMPQLVSIRMPALERVNAEIVVLDNPQLQSIELDSLQSVFGMINLCQREPYPLTFAIDDNPELTTLNCLPSLQEALLRVTNNPKLSQCELDAVEQRDVAACMQCDR
jgi:hypothetical protein